MTDINNTLKANIHDRKSGFSLLAQGFVCEWNEMAAQMKLVGSAMKESVMAPFKMAKDIKKGFKLVAQGKFRELRGKVAQRLASNLQTLSIIGDKTYEKMPYTAEQKFGVGKVETSDFSKAQGELVRPIMSTYRHAFKRLFNGKKGR